MMSALATILNLFGPLRAAKFWVAAVMALALFVRVYFNIDLGLDEATITAVVGGIGAVLVWLVPNLKRNPDIPVLTERQAREQTGHTGPIENRSGRT